MLQVWQISNWVNILKLLKQSLKILDGFLVPVSRSAGRFSD
jgi:hypothetical protein